MDSTKKNFCTTHGEFCPPGIDLKELSDSELEALYQKTRDATLSLEAELEKRHSPTVAAPSNLINEYETKLRTSLQQIKSLGRLDPRAAKSVELAVSILMNEQTARGSKIYQDFLNDIKRQCGGGLALLCAASLGKQNITAMNIPTRTSLVNHVTSKKASFCSPELDNLVTQYELPVDTGTLCSLHVAKNPSLFDSYRA